MEAIRDLTSRGKLYMLETNEGEEPLKALTMRYFFIRSFSSIKRAIGCYQSDRMFSVFLVISLLLPSASWGTGNLSCESSLPKSVDASICDDIRSTVFIIRYAIRDTDAKVKETVLTALKEAQAILDSTMATTIDDIRGMFSGSRRKRSTSDLRSDALSLAENSAKNIFKAVCKAENKIRSSITLAVLNADIQNDVIKTEAMNLLRKALNKRSILKEDNLVRRGTPYDVQHALSAASEEVKSAMKDAVTTSIQEYKKIMDLFATRLKELFKRANIKGNIDQAEQDIEALALKSSFDFIKFYDSSTTAAIGKAIKSVEGLLLKSNNIGSDDPTVLVVIKFLLEAAGMNISKVVVETKEEGDEEIRSTIIAAAEKMLKDYQTIEDILKKHGV